MCKPIRHFEVVEYFSVIINYCDADMVNMSTQELQYIICFTSNYVFTWHHRASGALLHLHRYIHSKLNINNQYDNAINALGVESLCDISCCLW